MARAVIGANFGDEGKGLVTDWLANTGSHDVVVRFNGGCQAGHTVVTPEGQRHVFSHFGSGSFVGLPTFFSQHAIVNPVLFLKERLAMPMTPTFACHLDCRITTPWDMNFNQDVESTRGAQRHGSCGVGIFQTIRRDRHIPFRMRHLLQDYRPILDRIQAHYGGDNGAVMHNFCRDLEEFMEHAHFATIRKWKDPIFEGAQGLLLCQSNMDMYPHLTPSRCGLNNVRELMYEARQDLLEAYFVSRTYLTRHGVGPLADEDPKMCFADETNVENPWQGPLRFAPLDYDSLLKRIHAECHRPRLVMTHCDQLAPKSTLVGWQYYNSFGETRHNIAPSISAVSRGMVG